MALSLTPKRLKFCEEYIQNQTLAGAVRAYEVAYQTKANLQTMTREARRLLKNKKIQEYIENVRKEVAKKMGITLEQHLNRLEELGKKAEESGQYSAAISAETQRGKASGLYVDQKKVEGNLTIVWGDEDEDKDSL